jgi:FAD/FMN-containing dehydrogenase
VTGYDVASTLVGSEGTLAVLGDITLRLIPQPEAVQTMLATFAGTREAVEAASEIVARHLTPRCLELLDAATTFAYEQAQAQGLAEELRPSFDTIAQQMATLRQISTEFRDPAIWTILRLLGGIVDMIVFILLDGDLVKHDYAEGAIEHELSTIYGRLGAPVAAPDPARLKQKHNYVGRVIATIATCGIYALWWEYDVMVEGNRHFEHNWAWEDSLANGVQQVIATS